jgi:hypothetical protein
VKHIKEGRMAALRKRLNEVAEKREELRGVFSQLIQEYEIVLLSQVKETINSLKVHAEIVQQSEEIFDKAKDEIERVSQLEDNIHQIRQIIFDFTSHSQSLLIKKDDPNPCEKEYREDEGEGRSLRQLEFH